MNTNNTALHPLFLKNLRKTSLEHGLILLVRHSIRYPITEGAFGNEIGLTPEGIQLAQQLGRFIHHDIAFILSSPLDRCISTGLAMIEGNDTSLDIQTSKVLGDPGAFVEDEKAAGEYFLKHGILKIVNDLLAENAVPEMKSVKEGYGVLLDFNNNYVSLIILL